MTYLKGRQFTDVHVSLKPVYGRLSEGNGSEGFSYVGTEKIAHGIVIPSHRDEKNGLGQVLL